MHRPGTIAKDLYLDMARLGHKLFHQHIGIAKGSLRLRPCTIERRLKTVRLFDKAHTLAAATGDRLDQYRIADLTRLCRQQIIVLIVTMISWHHRHPRFDHQRLGRIL